MLFRSTDYCALIPVAPIFRLSDGMTFLIWLCLVAAIWYFFQKRIKGDGCFVCMLALMNYLIMRMQMNIENFALCFGQMFAVYVLLPRQDTNSAARSAKAFCWSLVITSTFALFVRSTPELVAIRGPESAAICGTSIMRFYGLFRDPNFYMTFLVVGLALLFKLKNIGRLQGFVFWLLSACMTVFGVLTYSKTFFLALVMLIGLYILWYFWSRKAVRGMLMVCVLLVAARYLLVAEDSPFAVVLVRLTNSDTISGITTGRTDIYAQYMKAIFENMGTFLFGRGLGADSLYKDPHNLTIELVYYIGFIGLALYAVFGILMFRKMNRKIGHVSQNIISKYIVVIMLLVLYVPLNGMFTMFFYMELFLTLMAVLLVKMESPQMEGKRNAER